MVHSAQDTLEAVKRFRCTALRKLGLMATWRSHVSGLFSVAPFPGCVLLYKQDFTKKLGLCCITCTYCSQTCQRGVTEQLDGSTWDFCSEDCKSKYLLWYCKVRGAACHKGRKGQQGARAVVPSSGCGSISREEVPTSPASVEWHGLSQGKGPSTF